MDKEKEKDLLDIIKKQSEIINAYHKYWEWSKGDLFEKKIR